MKISTDSLGFEFWNRFAGVMIKCVINKSDGWYKIVVYMINIKWLK